MTAPIACVDAGVDYLTCSFNDEADHTRLSLYIARCQRKEAREGNYIHSWGMSGYKGQKVGGLEWGVRHDGAIVRLSGFTAQRYWKRFGKLATNCSRIDLQQTMVHDEPWAQTMREHWKEMRGWWIENKHRPRPREIGGPTGIESVYSGERTSEVYLRCYHRGSKKGLEASMGHIRYEAELKGARAYLTLHALIAGDNNSSWLQEEVAGYFRARGCRLTWANILRSQICVTARANDVDRSLAWLEKSVAPAVRRLVELGHGRAVLDALHFSGDIGPDGPILKKEDS